MVGGSGIALWIAMTLSPFARPFDEREHVLLVVESHRMQPAFDQIQRIELQPNDAVVVDQAVDALRRPFAPRAHIAIDEHAMREFLAHFSAIQIGELPSWNRP